MLEAIDDPRPSIPHPEVMAMLDRKIKQLEKKQKAKDAYNTWLIKEVQIELDDPSPETSHAEVMAEVAAKINALKKQKK